MFLCQKGLDLGYLVPTMHVLLALRLSVMLLLGCQDTLPASSSQLEQVLWNKLDCLLEHDAATA